MLLSTCYVLDFGRSYLNVLSRVANETATSAILQHAIKKSVISVPTELVCTYFQTFVERRTFKLVSPEKKQANQHWLHVESALVKAHCRGIALHRLNSLELSVRETSLHNTQLRGCVQKERILFQ